jgi:hypothetical protein
MPYIMEVSRGSRGRRLSGIGRGATGAFLAVGSARALMICWAALSFSVVRVFISFRSLRMVPVRWPGRCSPGVKPRIRMGQAPRARPDARGSAELAAAGLLSGDMRAAAYRRAVMPEASARICGPDWSGGM